MKDFILLVLHLGWMALAFFTFVNWRRLKDLNDTPLASIAQAQPGMVAKIPGRTAFAGEQRLSLLGQVPCVWYHWSVSRYRGTDLRPGSSPGASTDWDEAMSGSSVEPFAIIDDAGNRLLIFPMSAEVSHTGAGSWGADYLDSLNETARDRILGGIGVLSAISGFGELRFSEVWLAADVNCFVLGRVDKPGPEHGADLGPDVKGCITEAGHRAFVVQLGAPAQAGEEMRQAMTGTAIGTVVVFIIAVIGSILA